MCDQCAELGLHYLTKKGIIKHRKNLDRKASGTRSDASDSDSDSPPVAGSGSRRYNTRNGGESKRRPDPAAGPDHSRRRSDSAAVAFVVVPAVVLASARAP